MKCEICRTTWCLGDDEIHNVDLVKERPALFDIAYNVWQIMMRNCVDMTIQFLKKQLITAPLHTKEIMPNLV